MASEAMKRRVGLDEEKGGGGGETVECPFRMFGCDSHLTPGELAQHASLTAFHLNQYKSVCEVEKQVLLNTTKKDKARVESLTLVVVRLSKLLRENDISLRSAELETVLQPWELKRIEAVEKSLADTQHAMDEAEARDRESAAESAADEGIDRAARADGQSADPLVDSEESKEQGEAGDGGVGDGKNGKASPKGDAPGGGAGSGHRPAPVSTDVSRAASEGVHVSTPEEPVTVEERLRDKLQEIKRLRRCVLQLEHEKHQLQEEKNTLEAKVFDMSAKQELASWYSNFVHVERHSSGPEARQGSRGGRRGGNNRRSGGDQGRRGRSGGRSRHGKSFRGRGRGGGRYHHHDRGDGRYKGGGHTHHHHPQHQQHYRRGSQGGEGYDHRGGPGGAPPDAFPARRNSGVDTPVSATYHSDRDGSDTGARHEWFHDRGLQASGSSRYHTPLSDSSYQHPHQKTQQQQQQQQLSGGVYRSHSGGSGGYESPLPGRDQYVQRNVSDPLHNRPYSGDGPSGDRSGGRSLPGHSGYGPPGVGQREYPGSGTRGGSGGGGGGGNGGGGGGGRGGGGAGWQSDSRRPHSFRDERNLPVPSQGAGGGRWTPREDVRYGRNEPSAGGGGGGGGGSGGWGGGAGGGRTGSRSHTPIDRSGDRLSGPPPSSGVRSRTPLHVPTHHSVSPPVRTGSITPLTAGGGGLSELPPGSRPLLYEHPDRQRAGMGRGRAHVQTRRVESHPMDPNGGNSGHLHHNSHRSHHHQHNENDLPYRQTSGSGAVGHGGYDSAGGGGEPSLARSRISPSDSAPLARGAALGSGGPGQTTERPGGGVDLWGGNGQGAW